jgi:hypothetical protein
VGRPPSVGVAIGRWVGHQNQLVSRPLTSHGRTKPNYVCLATGKLHLAIAAEPVEKLITERVLDRLDHTGLVKVLGARAKADDTGGWPNSSPAMTPRSPSSGMTSTGMASSTGRRSCGSGRR